MKKRKTIVPFDIAQNNKPESGIQIKTQLNFNDIYLEFIIQSFKQQTMRILMWICCLWWCSRACILAAPYDDWIGTEIEDVKNKTPFNSIDSKLVHWHTALQPTQLSFGVLFPRDIPVIFMHTAHICYCSFSQYEW